MLRIHPNSCSPLRNDDADDCCSCAGDEQDWDQCYSTPTAWACDQQWMRDGSMRVRVDDLHTHSLLPVTSGLLPIPAVAARTSRPRVLIVLLLLLLLTLMVLAVRLDPLGVDDDHVSLLLRPPTHCLVLRETEGCSRGQGVGEGSTHTYTHTQDERYEMRTQREGKRQSSNREIGVGVVSHTPHHTLPLELAEKTEERTTGQTPDLMAVA